MVDRHREHLLAESRAQLEIELSSFSARGASPVTCASDAELDSPASLAAQDFPDVQEACGQDPPVVQDAHDCKRRQHVTAQDYLIVAATEQRCNSTPEEHYDFYSVITS
jgi:hypothetical protein